jgi:hypothetical protein
MRIWQLIRDGNIEDLHHELKQVGDVNKPWETDSGYNYLITFAASLNQTEVVHALLDYDVDVLVTDEFNRTALAYAKHHQNEPLINKLSQRAAAQTARTRSEINALKQSILSNDQAQIERSFHNAKKNVANAIITWFTNLLLTSQSKLDNIIANSDFFYNNSNIYRSIMYLRHRVLEYDDEKNLAWGYLISLFLNKDIDAFRTAIEYDFPIDSIQLIAFNRLFNPLQIALIFYHDDQKDFPFIDALLDADADLEFDQLSWESPRELLTEKPAENRQFLKTITQQSQQISYNQTIDNGPVDMALNSNPTPEETFIKYATIDNALRLAVTTYTESKQQLILTLAEESRLIYLAEVTMQLLTLSSVNTCFVSVCTPSCTPRFFPDKTTCHHYRDNEFAQCTTNEETPTRPSQIAITDIYNLLNKTYKSATVSRDIRQTFFFYPNEHVKDQVHHTLANELLTLLVTRCSKISDERKREFIDILTERGDHFRKQGQHYWAYCSYRAAQVLHTTMLTHHYMDHQKMLRLFALCAIAIKPINKEHALFTANQQYAYATHYLMLLVKYILPKPQIEALQKTPVYSFILNKSKDYYQNTHAKSNNTVVFLETLFSMLAQYNDKNIEIIYTMDDEPQNNGILTTSDNSTQLTAFTLSTSSQASPLASSASVHKKSKKTSCATTSQSQASNRKESVKKPSKPSAVSVFSPINKQPKPGSAADNASTENDDNLSLSD